MAKFELEQKWLSMSPASQWLGEDHGVRFSRSAGLFDINNLRLVPQFNEKDPDTYFVLFKRVVETREWTDADRVLLL